MRYIEVCKYSGEEELKKREKEKRNAEFVRYIFIADYHNRLLEEKG